MKLEKALNKLNFAIDSSFIAYSTLLVHEGHIFSENGNGVEPGVAPHVYGGAL